MTLVKKIWVMVFMSGLVLFMVGAWGVWQTKKTYEQSKLLHDDALAAIVALAEARQSFTEIRIFVYAHVTANSDADRKELEDKINERITQIGNYFTTYEKTLDSELDKKLFAADLVNVKQYVDVVKEKILPLSRKDQDAEALSIARTIAKPLGDKTLTDFDTHVDYNEKNADRFMLEAEQSYHSAIWQSVISIAFGLIFIIAYAFFLIRKFKTRLNNLRNSLEDVSHNLDFTKRVDDLENDELGVMASAQNKLLARLQVSIRELTQSAHSVEEFSRALATTSNQVASAANQQNIASANVAATIEQMTVSVNHVADRAQEASQASITSGNLATSSSDIISSTTSDINQIAETVYAAESNIRDLESKANDISRVIQVIKDVADQTNLLALNAAIEAARAGEQGRGFAVVADEVRKLAERTASSAQEINITITDMLSSAGRSVEGMDTVVRLVGTGVSGAENAIRAIQQVREGTQFSTSMVSEITVAIKEQGVAAVNIAQQVEAIAQMSEESSAAAAHTAESAVELEKLSERMKQLVDVYKV